MAMILRGPERAEAIVDSAERIAESQGWEAVTVRALAGAIGCSQPVLYGHFPRGRAEIVTAVALRGFQALARELEAAAPGSAAERLAAGAEIYLELARDRPALYRAMFQLPSEETFGPQTPRAELQAAFAVLRAPLAALAGEGEADDLAELFWAGLHGLASLDAAHRLRPEARERRRDQLVAMMIAEAERRGQTRGPSA